MDLNYNDEELAFRKEVQDFLKGKLPARHCRQGEKPAALDS